MSSLLLFFTVVNIVSQINSEEVICTGGACSCPVTAPTPGEFCILNCAREDVCKAQALTCRSGSPCYVRCEAKNSCSEGTMINAFDATDVTVVCAGDSACKDSIEIICGTGDCILHCGDSTSCESFGAIYPDNSKGFMCSGLYCPVIGSGLGQVPAPFSASPTPSPSSDPTASPTNKPTSSPTNDPLEKPSKNPITIPSQTPSIRPTNVPSITSISPTQTPSSYPSIHPTFKPTSSPSVVPTLTPTDSPSYRPSFGPSNTPSMNPSERPSNVPTFKPSYTPSNNPSMNPTFKPSMDPTRAPILEPTDAPSIKPTIDPTDKPSLIPTDKPSLNPTDKPTLKPTAKPSYEPTSDPSMDPTLKPTQSPSNIPSEAPSLKPSMTPSIFIRETIQTMVDAVDLVQIKGENKGNAGAIVAAVTGIAFMLIAFGWFVRYRFKQKKEGKPSDDAQEMTLIDDETQNEVDVEVEDADVDVEIDTIGTQMEEEENVVQNDAVMSYASDNDDGMQKKSLINDE